MITGLGTPAASRSPGRTAIVLVLAAALFATGFGLRLAIDNPNDAIFSIYVLPIVLVGVELGLIPALLAALLAYALFLAWTVVEGVDVDALGYAVRALVFFPIALVVGSMAPRLRAAFEQSRSLAVIVESSDDAIFSHTLGGRILSWNEAAERIFGYSAHEAVRMELSDLAPPGGPDGFALALDRVRKGERAERLDTRAVERRGRRLELALSMSPIFDEGGNLVAAASIASDVTARKRAEGYLRAQHRVVQSLTAIESTSDVGAAILPIVGEAGRWLCGAYWTADDAALRCSELWTSGAVRAEFRAIEEGTEYGIDDAPRAPAWEVGEASPVVPGTAEAAGRGIRTQLWVPIVIGKEILGAFQLFDRRTRERDDDLLVVMGAIASQVGNHLKRHRAEEEVERAKEEFFALVSHELRTPLTSIIGYTGLVAEVEADRLSEEGRRYLEVVNRNAEREMRLVGDLLLLVKIQEGTFNVDLSGRADLERIVEEAVEAARPSADERGITVSAETDSISACQGDPHRIGQVVDNLLSNAIKFTSPGGRVAIRLGSRNGAAAIEVEDTGIGIPSAERDRLFERLYRTSGATAAHVPGLGLGLTIVKAIVEAHGGMVEVSSTEGVGTTFSVQLPLTAARPE
jgi:PAS domain S-box-containing protein